MTDGPDPSERKVSFIPPDKEPQKAAEGKWNMECVVEGGSYKCQLQTVTTCRNEDLVVMNVSSLVCYQCLCVCIQE